MYGHFMARGPAGDRLGPRPAQAPAHGGANTGISTSVHHVYRADSATRIGAPEGDFESSRIDWVPLDTIPGLISAGKISSATTLAALLYTLIQDGPCSR
jgi:hypothetical protein